MGGQIGLYNKFQSSLGLTRGPCVKKNYKKERKRNQISSQHLEAEAGSLSPASTLEILCIRFQD